METTAYAITAIFCLLFIAAAIALIQYRERYLKAEEQKAVLEKKYRTTEHMLSRLIAEKTALQATISGSAKTDSVIVIQQANALASSTGHTITSVKLDGVNDDIDITKSAQTITVLGSGTYTKTYTSGATESANFNLGASDISVSGTGFSYSNFTISVAANSGAERTCTVTASYSGATNVTRTITQAMGIVAPSLSLDTHSLSGSTLTMKAYISSAGGGTITACGFERGNTSSLGTDVSASTVQSGEFTADVSVIPGHTIYWRAYATNEAGTTYTTIANTTV